MRDLIKKWWNRTWTNWEFDSGNKVYANDFDKKPIAIYSIYKRTSNDGLVEYKKIRKF